MNNRIVQGCKKTVVHFEGEAHTFANTEEALAWIEKQGLKTSNFEAVYDHASWNYEVWREPADRADCEGGNHGKH